MNVNADVEAPKIRQRNSLSDGHTCHPDSENGNIHTFGCLSLDGLATINDDFHVSWSRSATLDTARDEHDCVEDDAIECHGASRIAAPGSFLLQVGFLRRDFMLFVGEDSPRAAGFKFGYGASRSSGIAFGTKVHDFHEFPRGRLPFYIISGSFQSCFRCHQLLPSSHCNTTLIQPSGGHWCSSPTSCHPVLLLSTS